MTDTDHTSDHGGMPAAEHPADDLPLGPAEADPAQVAQHLNRMLRSLARRRARMADREAIADEQVRQAVEWLADANRDDATEAEHLERSLERWAVEHRRDNPGWTSIDLPAGRVSTRGPANPQARRWTITDSDAFVEWLADYDDALVEWQAKRVGLDTLRDRFTVDIAEDGQVCMRDTWSGHRLDVEGLPVTVEPVPVTSTVTLTDPAN